MRKEQQPEMAQPAEWLGDCHPLLEQLGSAHGLAAAGGLSASQRSEAGRDIAALRRFLRDYSEQLLVPVELPAIQDAYGHASRHELRELLELDRKMADEAAVKPFALASRRIGQSELRKLRPLHDERIVGRYLEAVDLGRANAWHTLVYGLTLALYSMPLRQGLLGYGFQTVRGFIGSAAQSMTLSEHERGALLDEQCAALPDAVQSLIHRRSSAWQPRETQAAPS